MIFSATINPASRHQQPNAKASAHTIPTAAAISCPGVPNMAGETNGTKKGRIRCVCDPLSYLEIFIS